MYPAGWISKPAPAFDNGAVPESYVVTGPSTDPREVAKTLTTDGRRRAATPAKSAMIPPADVTGWGSAIGGRAREPGAKSAVVTRLVSGGRDPAATSPRRKLTMAVKPHRATGSRLTKSPSFKGICGQRPL